MTGVTVSGPGIDRAAPSEAVGVSLALTYASRAAKGRTIASYYVRDEAGVAVGRADADERGGVQVWKLDADARSAPRRGLSTTRASAEPGTTRPDQKEEVMPEKTTTRRKATASAGAGAAATKKKAAGEKGTDLLATLMVQVEDKVAGVERVPNPSQTYTRLQVGGKTFAYVFPPRKSGLLVKIPRNLLAVEASLPSGHGFHRVGWGLTRTITKASEAPKTAAALAVAAAALAKAEESETAA